MAGERRFNPQVQSQCAPSKKRPVSECYSATWQRQWTFSNQSKVLDKRWRKLKFIYIPPSPITVGVVVDSVVVVAVVVVVVVVVSSGQLSKWRSLLRVMNKLHTWIGSHWNHHITRLEEKSIGTYCIILLDFSLTVKAAPHECVIRTSQP